MLHSRILKLSISLLAVVLVTASLGQTTPGKITISSPKISLVIDCLNKAVISSVVVNGEQVVGSVDGVYTSVKAAGITYSSLQSNSTPVVVETPQFVKLSDIKYGSESFTVSENWIFTKKNNSIDWSIERTVSNPLLIEEAALPVFNFNSINTWEGAYQGYGGLAWFYLFNEKLCTYGVHTNSTSFWNSKTGNGLEVKVNAPGEQVAMKYSRTDEDRLAYSISVAKQEMLPAFDSITHRRRFIRGRTDVWAPFQQGKGYTKQTISLCHFDYQEKYGRGELKGLNGKQVSDILGTISRIGVIDAKHFGGNSWHTPYGPICLHEQYIAQMGLGINDPEYLNGYKNSLDFYRDNAIKPDGRVWARWAYTNEDAAPEEFTSKGFYEAQWGILMDANPDFVTNVAELYDQTGDLTWVKEHQLSCEKALEWVLKRDENNNGLVEMMTDSTSQQRGSDWIDIVWASYENAFVNAKLYLALTKWAAIERQLNNIDKAVYYENYAAKLKANFNKNVEQGGFWDEANQCYVYWLDKDKSIHGRNMVTPVNFMAIAYGICDDKARQKIILDKIETQMKKENLFFWPLCMSAYKQEEVAYWQYPFPKYENGDLFLSWGAVGVQAYASYDPAIALKYVRNVLNQYSKDGLAFQRYSRVKQDGQGDDILSGNGLTIVGLYQAIYGINPMYNRFYLNPHITAELAGTRLNYNFRGEKLSIVLKSNDYAVSNGKFSIGSTRDFGFFTTKNKLSYFNRNEDKASFEITCAETLNLGIKSWSSDVREWTSETKKATELSIVNKGLKTNTLYDFTVNSKVVARLTSNDKGELELKYITSGELENWVLEVD